MATTQENRIIFSIEFTEKGAIRKIGTATVSVKKFEAELKKATIANKQFNNTLSGREGMTTNAGLAGATLTEFGRTISDLPYGIRGVANNLSQLSTLFTTMVAKVDSNVKGTARVGKAFKMLGTQLMGPLGIVLAFQAAIAALDFFYGANKKAKGSVDELTKSLNAQVGLNKGLSVFINMLKDSNSSLEIQTLALAKLKKKGYDPTIGTLEEFEEALESVQKIENKEAESQRNITAILEKRSVKEKELAAEKLKHAGADAYYQDKIQDTMDALQQEIDIMDLGIMTVQTSLQSAAEDIVNSSELSGNPFFASLLGLKSSKKEDPKESEVAKILKGLNEEVQKMSAENARELLDIEKKLALDEIALARGSTPEKNEAIRLINQKFAIELRDFREEELAEFKTFAEKQVDESVKYINDLYKDLQKKNKELAKETAAVQKTEQDKVRELLKQTRIDAQLTQQAFTSTLSVLSSLNDMRQEFHQAEIDRLNREKDVVLNNDSITQTEKEKRLKAIEVKEIAAQKRKIKSERDMFTLEQTLAIAQNVMKAKFFVMEQVMNAQLLASRGGQAMSNIMLSATEELSEGAMSIGTFMRVLGPTGVIAYGASLAVAVASIVKARQAAKNQIKNLVPSASGGGGGGGGSVPSVQAPAFNVVGATQESQLAQAISGADSKPLKAFVVASDISTAQELERSKIEGASIG